MKGIFSVLALGLASLAAATDNHNTPPKPTTTLTTYTTVTTCPITSTQYEHGTTKVITTLTTSTIVVTKCEGCDGVTTIHEPDGQDTTTTEVLVTYTTTCPVTEVRKSCDHVPNCVAIVDTDSGPENVKWD